jgi:DNA primase
MEDRHVHVRAMLFEVIARALGIDISKFKLRKGGTWAGPCPVHRPKKNSTSFTFNVDGRYGCFSCSAKGRGSIDLAMAVNGIGFQEAVRLLEPYLSSVVTQAARPVIATLQEVPTENKPFRSTYAQYFRPHPWLEARGISQETLARYGSGYYENSARKSAYNGSVLLKISRWSDGETVGWLSRNICEETPERPKYRFPEGLAKSLEVFGAYELKAKAPLRIVYVVESPFTVLKFHQLGVPCVATYGWSVSEQQAEIIGQLAKGTICLPDFDKRGAFEQSAFLLARRIWVRCPQMPEGVADPESLTLEQIKALTA